MTAQAATVDRARGAQVAWSDGAIVERVKRGDVDAYCELVARYQDRLFSFLSRSVASRADAEDLAQDILVQAFGAIRSFRSDASFKTWLFRIAHNRLVDYSRRTRKRNQVVAASLDDRAEGDGALDERLGGPREQEPPHELCRGELSEAVRAAVAALSDKLRSVIVLYDFEGCTYEEIAAVVGIPIGTVKSRLFLARAELKRRLAPLFEPAER